MITASKLNEKYSLAVREKLFWEYVDRKLVAKAEQGLDHITITLPYDMDVQIVKHQLSERGFITDRRGTDKLVISW